MMIRNQLYRKCIIGGGRSILNGWVINGTVPNIGLRYLRSGIVTRSNEIKTLEDLSKLKNLDDVDPELIRKLINERTSELNIQNEMEMLKHIQNEERKTQDIPIKRFIRPTWMFLLMSSTFYLLGHYIWWKLEYDEVEKELDRQVTALEEELHNLIEEHRVHGENEAIKNKKHKHWYKFWS
ncbi:hypothetical protein Kpol_1048p41 [Vanderwaltozyma polyspora DSM 70294]|uniref:Inner membrane assembly complex subunit 17 n=1 Tax=Vanderwaltozyma polyspora (strain ATCC 22028 / DSM 70294 / BCRC 21397 / CBS 2163 / NBRC 10782 / NRRL Y-8283 / UCD 57-17) TaxID=436907 RepID=INA17_VANPO|nr:uncharacterized protein Kpol_1048p41 [Vanderwaltozyma polyspora DSM 70294]A7TGK3.1 RecName: Full=Inner membrane assembly complex subunit 17; Flags: Precursor [Vanderwaltozyma polyspora DSM 70294]EDO18610.1 hypothetical protein Kpol_1048p41 [Vanderwaltozyma polyspora DSM 70294]